MFSLAIATTQALYLELGLGYQFKKNVSDRLDLESNIDIPCITRLLIRCKLVL